MTEAEEIIRVAAKGDGVTASGRRVAFAAPGDVIQSDGSVQPGPDAPTDFPEGVRALARREGYSETLQTCLFEMLRTGL